MVDHQPLANPRPWPGMRSLFAVACIASLLLAGCAGPGTGTGDEPPIDLILDADREQIQAGQWVNLTVTVENEGDEPYTYQHPGCPPEPVQAEVAWDGGEPIRLYPYGEEPMYGTCAVREVTLEPGQQVQITLNWNGRTQQDQPEPHNGSEVEPGSYELVVELARADDGPTFEHGVTVEVEG